MSKKRPFSPGRWLSEQLGKEVDGAGLGLFRIIWGALMIVEGCRKLPKAGGLFSPDYFHFKYSLFPWVEPLPANWLVCLEIVVMIACAALVMLGLFYRCAAIGFALLYTHIFLIEKVYFNNHFYLTALLAWILCFCAADHCYSLTRLRHRKRGLDPGPDLVPMWNYILLRGQIIIVYFFGGISKLNPDWLVGEPIRHWFGTKQEIELKPPISWFPEILQQEWFVWFISYSGMIFDLAVGFLLLNRKTFWPAVAMLVVFHITNNAIFKIGIFPFLGMGLISIFFSPGGPRFFFQNLERKFDRSRGVETPPRPLIKPVAHLASRTTTLCVTGYLALHSLLPLRWMAYGGHDPSWTEVGHYFAWRMMLRDKDGFVKFYFNPPEAERLLEQPGMAPDIGQSHLVRLVKNPHFLLQYVHELDRIFKANGKPDVEIRCLAIVSLNGRPYQLMVDPSRDLTKAGYGFFAVPDWIVPLQKDGRAGGYAKDIEDRRKQIESVFTNDALPLLRQDDRALPLFLNPTPKKPPAP